MQELIGTFLAVIRRLFWFLEGKEYVVSQWDKLLVALVHLTVLGLLFRTYIGPFLLRSISKRIRVRSVSLRSIRGVYLRTGIVTCKIDRIGLAYHSSAESARRFSVKVEGLCIELYHLAPQRVDKALPQAETRNTRIPALADFSSSPLAHKLWSFYSAIYARVEPFGRPILRTIFVTSLRVLIRCLPALTQVIDFELERCLVTIANGQDVHFTIHNASLSTTVNFSSLGIVLESNGGDLRARDDHRGFFSMAQLQGRLAGSLKRVWSRAWGQAKGSASFDLRIRSIGCAIGIPKDPQLKRPRTNMTESSHNIASSCFDYVTHSSNAEYQCIGIPGSTEFRGSCEFGPRKGIIEKQSICISLRVNTVHMTMDRILALLQSLQQKSCLVSQESEISTLAQHSDANTIGSPIYTRLTTSVPFGPWGRDSTTQKKKPTSLIPLVRSLECSIGDMRVLFILGKESGANQRIFAGHTRGISVSAKFREHGKDTLQRDVLGSRHNGDPNYDADVLSFSASMKEIIIDRRESADKSPLVRVIYIGPIGLKGFMTQWSFLTLPPSSLIQGDPNASLLVASLSITSPQLSERMDMLTEVLAVLQPPAKALPPQRPARGTLSFIPRMRLDISVNDVTACLIAVDAKSQPISSVILSSTQCVMTLSSNFNYFPLQGPDLTALDGRSCIPFEKAFTFNSVLGPAFVTSLTKPFSLDTSNRVAGNVDSPSGIGDPLLSVSAFELSLEGQTLGTLYDEERLVVLDLPSTILDLSCVTDAISIELWQPSAVASLTHLLRFATSLAGDGKPTMEEEANGLTFDVQAHFAVGQLGIIVTGKDLNPDEDGSLSRGIALRSGFAFQYCSLPDQGNTVRLRRRHAQPHARQQLYLSDELITDALSLSNRVAGGGESVAVSRFVVWDAAVRSAVATNFAADHSYETAEEGEELKSTEFLWITRVEVEAFLAFNKDVPSETRRVQVNLKVPYLHTRLQLADAYCSMLAMSTLKSLSAARSRVMVTERTTSKTEISLRGSVDVCQALIKLPLQEQLSFRLNGLRVRKSVNSPINLDFASLLVWAPLSNFDGRWEEIIRLRTWRVILTISPTEPIAVVLEGEGAQVRIPHTYVLADLILDLNVSFKCLKHLSAAITSRAGTLSPIPYPSAEAAKVVPVISLKLSCFSIDIADDPLESKLGVAWRAGLVAARSRIERDEAFETKVAAIQLAEASQGDIQDGRFSPKHTVSIEEARERLMQVHAISWTSVHREFRDEQRRKEDTLRRRIPGEQLRFFHDDIKPLVPVSPVPKYPPLLRIVFNRFSLGVTQPLFSSCDLPEFLHSVGNGLPKNTTFSLLIPMHLNVSLGATSVTLRDYPLPLLEVPQDLSDTATAATAWAIDTDFVIAEEMGDSSCVIWKDCTILSAGVGSTDTKALTLSVPKTTMPVKTYARPCVNVLTTRTTEFCWGVSYNAALQDVMRIFDTLSSPPPDPSPIVGFWDKMRLILHWEVKVIFANEVHLNLKGSRDPYSITGAGAGFTFCWMGDTELTIGVENRDKELLQVVSNTMLIVIPDFTKDSGSDNEEPHTTRSPLDVNSGFEGMKGRYKKICAKFTSGIRWGIGFILERTCSVDCPDCCGTFACRIFDFKPHYDVQLRPGSNVPREKTPEDSFHEFRSDFIHLSTSLTSSVRHRKTSSRVTSNSFHLSPKTFAHFWAWWDLFDRFLSIPIRQGKQFMNTRPPSKKFGKHLATLKYRLSVSQLFISHVYMDESRECWTNGASKFVGIKALVDTFEADMHQREQEAIVSGILPGTTKKIRHKPFYAAEVKLAGLQLRGISAMFSEPLRRLIDVGESRNDLKDEYPAISESERPPKQWLDMDDFVETDWRPPDCKPLLRMPQIASCPRFTYFRRSSGHHQSGTDHQTTLESSRFGIEDTHACLMGQEPSVHRTQSDIVSQRLSILKVDLARLMSLRSDTSLLSVDGSESPRDTDISNDIAELERKIKHLERYIVQLRESDDQESPQSKGDLASYLMPSDISCPTDWTEFTNVYQFHCPKCTVEISTRDILMQYYYCSRSRKGFEYHMATRAVKFIRDQAATLSRLSTDTQEKEKRGRNATGLAAQAAAQAIRKILIGDEEVPTVINTAGTDEADFFNPMEGWSEGVSLEKSHFCLLLKPQVVLRSDVSPDSICILAAVQATLQSFAILDIANAEDPISGRVMTRSHTVLSGLQTFSPSKSCRLAYDSVPVEVLIDLRAESSDFDRLVPQTNATFRYDKFNRLRLRNNVNSAVASSSDQVNGHLQHQTDLMDVRVPRFTVTADSNNFRAIANVITNVLLRSNSAHKHHLNQVETLLFSYDFTDLFSAADVVEGLQLRLRRAVEQERNFETSLVNDDQVKLEMLKIKAHVFLLTEELNLIFDAIKLAQDKADDKHNDQKSALKVHASAREISWGMVDNLRDIIIKLAMKELDFSWLNRQDGSTVNNLVIGDVQAFDGSPDAEWPEILAKHREPSSHPQVKRGIFVLADWTVLAPVGGITIYERFNVELHPMRLQLEARVGKSIMEYVFPARRERQDLETTTASSSRILVDRDDVFGTQSSEVTRSDSGLLDLDKAPHESLLSPLRGGKRYSVDERRPTLSPATKRITSSRSFTDLRLLSRQNGTSTTTPVSSNNLFSDKAVVTDDPGDLTEQGKASISSFNASVQKQPRDDAAEMKSRSAQKTFILVRIASMHILLSFRKDGSFFCRDARIETRELQYRNRTLSFEELAEQFIPSDPTWRGWMRVALHQPLVPVFPVARELLSKTKWMATKGKVARQAKKLGQAARTSTTRLRGSSESGGSPSSSRVRSNDMDSVAQSDRNPTSMSSPSRKSGQSKRSTESK